MADTKSRGAFGLRTPQAVGERASEHKGRTLTVPGLTLIGIGGIIGAGFFLGSGLPIHMAGPGVLVAYLLGALITAQVVGALTSMAVQHPASGAYQEYPAKYLGRFAGYMQGWTYYLTSLLTIASEAVAMAVFVQLWLPNWPSLLLAGLFAAVIVVVNAFGVRSFERIESIMSVVKIGALVGFIVYGVVMLWSLRAGGPHAAFPATHGLPTSFLPNGWGGVLQSMVVVIFAYAGIGVFASVTSEMKNPRDIDRAAIWTVVALAVMYIASVGFVLWLVPWQSISTHASPFVAALRASGATVFATVFNAAILVAAFSVMAGALYSANQVLISLGASRDAPRQVVPSRHHRTPWVALGASTVLIAAFLILSTLLPANVYSFLVSASSYFTFFNWLMLAFSFLKWRKQPGAGPRFVSKLAFGQPVSTWVAIVLLIGLAGYSVVQPDQRVGFYAAVGIGALLAALYFLVARRRAEPHRREDF
ncbi:MAG: amino acid permease [Alicyclobacillus sp.]|nr:amino acid permease [Alicyclobacillus sp.]